MSRPRRLLMTVDAVGGVWQYATELAAALAPLGYETILALLGPAPSEAQRKALEQISSGSDQVALRLSLSKPDGSILRQAQGERTSPGAAMPGVTLIETGLALDWLSPDAASVAEAGEAIARLAAEHRVELVQLNQPALAADARFAMPVVAVAHSCVATWWDAVHGGPAPSAFDWQTALVAGGLARADAIVCPSAAFADAIRARYDLLERPQVVHNGRTPLAAPAGALHDFAFTAGRLWDEGKNLATLDRAAARLGIPFKAAGPLAGPHGERIALDHLHALGPIDERKLAGLLSARPVFVSAARYEPFGLAVLEAALAGCPLVLSDIPTFRELWDGAALFVDPDDAEGFAAAIEALVGDVPVRLARGDLARRCAARFTPARMAGGMAALYARLLAASAGREAAA